jgi:hypothetical protein
MLASSVCFRNISGLTEVATSIASAVDEQGVTTGYFPNDLQIALSRLSTALQRRREHGVAVTGIEGCCARAASAHAAAAPPRSEMNSRRFN